MAPAGVPQALQALYDYFQNSLLSKRILSIENESRQISLESSLHGPLVAYFMKFVPDVDRVMIKVQPKLRERDTAGALLIDPHDREEGVTDWLDGLKIEDPEPPVLVDDPNALPLFDASMTTDQNDTSLNIDDNASLASESVIRGSNGELVLQGQSTIILIPDAIMSSISASGTNDTPYVVFEFKRSSFADTMPVHVEGAYEQLLRYMRRLQVKDHKTIGLLVFKTDVIVMRTDRNNTFKRDSTEPLKLLDPAFIKKMYNIKDSIATRLETVEQLKLK